MAVTMHNPPEEEHWFLCLKRCGLIIFSLLWESEKMSYLTMYIVLYTIIATKEDPLISTFILRIQCKIEDKVILYENTEKRFKWLFSFLPNLLILNIILSIWIILELFMTVKSEFLFLHKTRRFNCFNVHLFFWTSLLWASTDGQNWLISLKSMIIFPNVFFWTWVFMAQEKWMSFLFFYIYISC